MKKANPETVYLLYLPSTKTQITLPSPTDEAQRLENQQHFVIRPVVALNHLLRGLVQN